MGRFSEIIEKSDFSVSPDVSKNPDQFAADQDLAGQTGLPVDYVERNRDEAEKVKKQNVDFSRFADMELGASLTDPAFSNLAQDDLDNLSSLERTTKELYNLSRLVPSAAYSTTGAAYSILGSASNLLSDAFTEAMSAGGIDYKDDSLESDIFGYIGSGAMGIAKEHAAISQSYLPTDTVIPAPVIGGVKSAITNLPPLIAAVIAKNPNIALGTMGGVVYGESNIKAKEAGLSNVESAIYSTNQMAAEWVTEKIPVGRLLMDVAQNSGFVKTLLAQMATEIPTEQAATIWQDFNDWLVISKDKTLADYAAERPGAAVDTLISTIVATGLQTSAISAGVYAADKLAGDRQKLQEAVRSAEQSNLKRRSPEQFRSFLQSVDPLANVFVPASAFDGVQLDPSNKTLAQVAAQLPQARALNGDVVIPVADVLTDIPADMFATVAPFVRVEADGVAEIDSRPDMKELIEQVNRESEMAVQSKAFQKDLSSQLVATARARPEEATKYAAVVGARLETLAVDKGMTFDEAKAEYIGELRVVGPESEVAGDNVLEQSQRFSEDNRLSNLSSSGPSWERIRESNPALAGVESADEEITIYRATVGETIRPDDFVAVDRSVAEMELENVLERDGAAKIIEQKVRVRDLLMGNDATEFVYFPEEKQFAQSVYHGTPHRFDKFSLQAIGTGEGAQAYGHGLYFAGKKEIAEYYRTALSNGVPVVKVNNRTIKGDVLNTIANRLAEKSDTISKEDVLSEIDERLSQYTSGGEVYAKWAIKELQDAKKKLEKSKQFVVELSGNKGNLYRADIPEDNELLDWDKSLSEQPEIMAKLKVKQKATYLHNELSPDMTGQQVVDRLSRGLTNRGVTGKQQASEYLDSLGIPGLRYLDATARGKETESHNYVIWDENRITIEAINDELMQAQEYAQKERGLISISDKEIVIKLTDASNRSTFIHEAGHLFLEIESRIAAKDGISEGQRKILDWLGVESFDQIKVEHHEKFARGFEAYAMEGRAPSKDLVEVFRSFARWLKKVYASMRELDVELNDDIRQFFDRMLAADQAVKEAERLTQYKALFKDAKSAGMTEQEFADYTANQVKAQVKGSEELQSKLLKELTRQTEKWWKEEMASEKEKEAESLGKEKLYQATAFLTGKTKLEGFDVHKMDLDVVKAMLPEGVTKQFRGMLAKGGLSPDEVAAMFDFASGQDLVNTIASSPTFNEAATAAAQQSMVDKHGDILNDGSLQQESQLAAHNEERGKLILAELRALNRKVGKDTINRDALKFSAKEVIGRTPLKDIHPGKYRTAEVRSAKEAATALAKKDYAAAAQAKLKQAANFYLYREAMEAKQKEQSWRRYLSAVPNRKYSTKDVHPDYIKQMRLLASVYDFRRNPDPAQLSGIGTWIKAQQDAPDADIAPQVLDVNLSMAMEATAKGEPVQVKNYRDMTLDELQGVYDMVKHLRWVGGQLSENEKVKLQAEYEKVAKNIADNGGDIVDVPREPTKRSRALSGLRQFGQDHLALANQIEELDGFEQFGPAFNLIYQGIIDSSNTELKFRRETSEKVNALFKDFGSSDFAEGKGEETITTEDGRKFTLSRRARVMLAMYWGSPDSRTAIMDGDGLTTNDVNKMLATLTDKELDLVDSIWKLNESFWPELAKVSKAMTGIVPAKVEHVPFAVNGRVMSGGYMRLFYMYDQRDSVQMVDTEGAKITRSGARIVTQTKHGARHERVGSGGRKVDLNVNNVFRALDEVIHDISFAETARSVTRAMRNPEVSGAIINHYGKEKYESITSSLEGIIAGNVSNSHPINNFIKHFRTAATYGMLGYSLRNAVQQPVALTNMFGRIGEVETIGAMYDFVVNRNKWGKFVQDRSEFMKNRTSLVNREVAEIMGKISGNVMTSTLKQHAFDLQTIGDSMIAYPGWLAAYRKGLKDFGSEQKAITYADESVSATIGSGLMKDMSPMLQGSGRLAQTVGPEMLKSITFMGSYFNVIGRLIYSATKQADFKSVRGVASYTRTMTWYLAAPAILSALLVGQGPDDDESWLAWSAKAIASYGFATVFMLRDLVSAASGFTPSSAWSRALDASIRASKGVYDVATGEKEGDKEDIAKILRSASYLYPLPGAGQAARTLEYIGSQEAGNEGDFNIYKAIVVGKDRD